MNETWHGHGPGCACFRCAGNLRDNPGRSQTFRDARKTIVIVLVIVAVALFIFARVSANEAAKSSPPPACQLLGGHWSIWDGWQCY